jgi:hypothetical protein
VPATGGPDGCPSKGRDQVGGREIVTTERRRREGPLRGFIDELQENPAAARRVPGTAVFLNRGKETTPLALRANIEYNQVLHEQVVILSIVTEPVPPVPVDERTVVDHLGHADDGSSTSPPGSATWRHRTCRRCYGCSIRR